MNLIGNNLRRSIRGFATAINVILPRPIGSGFYVKLRIGWPLLRGLAMALTQGRE
jgi:hypothetical protein